MTQRACWLLPLYRLLVGLYPPGFRAQFAAEMQQVFAALITEAAPHGQPPLRLCLREFGGVVIGVVREWLAVFQRRVRRFPVPSLKQPVTPAPWWEVLLTIFPGLCSLLGTGYVFLNQTPRTDIWYPGAFGALLNGLLLSWLLLSWLLFVALRCVVRQRFDPAALPLVGIATALFVVLGGTGLTAFALWHAVAGIRPVTLATIALYSTLLTVVVVGGFVARRQGAHALLVVLPVIYLAADAWVMQFVGDWATFGWLVLAPLALLRARNLGCQILAGSIPAVVTTWTAIVMNFSLLPKTLLDQTVMVLVLGGILILIGWCYALIGHVASRSNAPHEPERYT